MQFEELIFEIQWKSGKNPVYNEVGLFTSYSAVPIDSRKK